LFTDINSVWQNVTSDINLSTGYFKNVVDNSLLKVGVYSTSSLKYLAPSAMIRFDPPAGYAFKKGKLVLIDADDSEQTDRLWTKVIKIVGDGTNAGRGILTSGLGPVTFNDPVPSGAIAKRIVPKFINDLPTALESEIVTQVFNGLNFGLRFDVATSTWKVITASNLDLISDFNLGKAGDSTSNNLDSSWILAFVKDIDQYIVRIRGLNYVFGSVEQNRFYFDSNEKQYNNSVGSVVKDKVNVLGINKSSTGSAVPIGTDFTFEVDDTIKFDDGYESSIEIKVAFSDSDDDGIIDNPEAFEQIVGDDTQLNYLFFEEIVDEVGSQVYQLLDNSNNLILVVEKESLVDINNYVDGQLIYFYDIAENQVKQVDKTTNTLVLKSAYKGVIGRRNLKFQYIHNASVDRRIDPSVSNIIDTYLLTRSYDEAFRIYLAGGTASQPESPDSDSLKISFGSKLDLIKAISDDIVYHPVKYKVLFGAKADTKLQAQFKIVKNSTQTINDNDLKVRIVTALNEFFSINNWDFGDKFYLSELVTYVLNQVSPDISNIVIVPRQTTQSFGSLFEIQSSPDEIFVNGATVDDIEIVSAITAAEVRAPINSIVTTT
jgi:hypothetical protein